MSKTAYIILEKTFEYNDETYNETDGGSPSHTYTSEEKAKEEKVRLERTKWRSADIYNYCYSLADLSTQYARDKSGLARRLGQIINGKNAKMESRERELRKKLSGTLNGEILENAITTTLEKEFGEPKEVQLDEFTLPPGLTDEQVDAIRSVFNKLSFYEIAKTEID